MLSGQKLMFLRVKHDLSQKYISECLGVSREYISMMETGKKPMSEEIYQKYIDSVYGKLKPPKKEDKPIVDIPKKTTTKVKG